MYHLLLAKKLGTFTEESFPAFPAGNRNRGNLASLTVWKNEKFSLTKEIFRQINFLVISLVKTLLSRNICQKGVRANRAISTLCTMSAV